ncbi:MAG: rRNA maturation RNase YbeY [Bacteriovoracaceae bacterium]
MNSTKTYDGQKLTVHFTFGSKSLTALQQKKIKLGMKAFIATFDHEFKKFRGIKRFSLELSLIGDSAMKKINFKHRQKNKTTDVLSFPTEEDVRSLTKLKVPELFLGDILISKPVTIAQAQDFKISFEREFFHLFTHGLLHLLGYDHERSPLDEKKMFDLEEKLVKKMVVQLPKL